MATFETTVLQAEDMNATGLPVPSAVVDKLGGGKRPRVTVTLNGYTYRSTIAVYGGAFFLPLAAVHRDAAGVKAGQRVQLTVERDTAPREVEVPKDLAAALKKARARAAFDLLSFSHRKEHVRAIEDAKSPETRARRVDKAVAMVTGSTMPPKAASRARR
jgi:hypothetical protein